MREIIYTKPSPYFNIIAQSFKALFRSLISVFFPLFRVWWQTPLHRQLPPPHRTPVGSSLYLWRTQEITPQPTLTSRLSKCDDCKSVIFFTWSCTAGASWLYLEKWTASAIKDCSTIPRLCRAFSVLVTDAWQPLFANSPSGFLSFSWCLSCFSAF